MNSTVYVFIGFILVLVICIDAWIISSIARSDDPRQLKLGWSAVVVLLPLLGWGLWGRFGSRGMAYPPSVPADDGQNAIHETPNPTSKPTREKARYQGLP